jgi:hypothetical protein
MNAFPVVLQVDYEPMYHNYVALIGTLRGPRHTGSKYSFTLQVAFPNHQYDVSYMVLFGPVHHLCPHLCLLQLPKTA